MGQTRKDAGCRVDGCDKRAATRGLCHMHYYAHQHPGHPAHDDAEAAILPSQRGGKVGGEAAADAKAHNDERVEAIATAVALAEALGMKMTRRPEGLLFSNPDGGQMVLLTPSGGIRKAALSLDPAK